MKSQSTQSWLADHSLISDNSQLFTDNPDHALGFVCIDVASARVGALQHLFPDLCLDPITVSQ